MIGLSFQNLQKDPRYGADVLRLWAATIDYGKDTLLGRELIQQTAETLRKIRNSARFILGNLATVDPATLKELPDEISIVTIASCLLPKRYTEVDVF